MNTYEHTHFAHRESTGFVVDLFWDPTDAAHEFRVQIIDRRSGAGLVLFPTSGREALKAFHHPFATPLTRPSRRLAPAVSS
jgi:hypothetical protein